jgi:glycerol-3-phosphate dehydrogenase
MAQQTVDQMVRHLDRRVSPCRTAVEPLLPGEAAAAFSGILPPEFSRRAVEHFCANEWALHLDDVMLRRGGWHYYWADADRKAEQAAQWMADLLGWSPEEQAAELSCYRRAAGCQAAGKSPASAGRNQRHDREVHSVV